MEQQGIPGMGQGLGARMAQEQPQEDPVQKIAELLASGVTVEELMQKGVPQQLIEAAMKLLQQSESQATAQPQEGMSAMAQ